MLSVRVEARQDHARSCIRLHANVECALAPSEDGEEHQDESRGVVLSLYFDVRVSVELKSCKQGGGGILS